MRGSEKHQPLDAGRNLRSEGRGRRVHRHLLDEYHPADPAVRFRRSEGGQQSPGFFHTAPGRPSFAVGHGDEPILPRETRRVPHRQPAPPRPRRLRRQGRAFVRRRRHPGRPSSAPHRALERHRTRDVAGPGCVDFSPGAVQRTRSPRRNPNTASPRSLSPSMPARSQETGCGKSWTRRSPTFNAPPSPSKATNRRPIQASGCSGRREENLKLGIPVDEECWREILAL